MAIRNKRFLTIAAVGAALVTMSSFAETLQQEAKPRQGPPVAGRPLTSAKRQCDFSVGQTRFELVQACGEPAKYFDSRTQRLVSARPSSTQGNVWETYYRKTALSEYQVRILYDSTSGSQSRRLREVRFLPNRTLRVEDVARDLDEIVQLCRRECSVLQLEIGETMIVGERALFSFILAKDKSGLSDWRKWEIQQLVLAEKFSLGSGVELTRWSSMSAPSNAAAPEINSEQPVAASPKQGTGPFGFQFGLSKEQVLALVGRRPLPKEEDEDFLSFSTAPKPHNDFESYIVVIPADKGLLRLRAISKDIPTAVYGEELKSKFYEIKGALEEKYGPSQTFDFLRSGSIWNEPADWTMGLFKKERTLYAFWEFKDQPDHITAISLQAFALSREKGFLNLSYEFEGWSAYLDSKKALKNKVF